MGWRAKGATWAVLKPLARTMRCRATAAEQKLWQHLRQRRLGVRFRRQFVVDRFIADFYCAERNLVVEVDGAVHLDRHEVDAERDRFFATIGLRVLRVRNDQVLGDMAAVLQRIQAALDSTQP
jgi:very-short-patch-repair endonuclease